jgi:hypothetical protein
MGFKKSVANVAVDDNSPNEELDVVRPASEDEVVSGNENVLSATGAEDSSVSEVEANKPEEEVPPVQNLDEQLLASGGMELSDEPIDSTTPAPDTSVESVPASEQATSPEVDVPAVDAPANDEAKPRLERMVGNGNPLSPTDQRKAALAEKAASMPNYGGGGGGIGSLFSVAGQGVKSMLSGLGSGVKVAGGQKLADRFLQPTDPVSVAKRAFRQRYSAYDRAVNDMDAATDRRAASIDRFNEMIVSSEAGRTLKQMAETSKVDLHDFMSDVKSGKNSDKFALKCMETLERDPGFGQAAKSITAAQDAYTAAEKVAETNLGRLATDHGADINVAFESNRLVDAVEKAETDAKKPLPLEVSLKDGDTGAEDKLDTEKQHKKFMEALDKIKESISALIQKIMSKIGLGGPK